MAPRVLLADDHLIVRQALRSLLESEGVAVVGEAADGRQAVELARQVRPDIAVLDLSMPVLNGIDAGREILKSGLGTAVILLTIHREDHYLLAALKGGVAGYVLKTQAAADLLQAIHEVAAGKTYLSPGVSRALLNAYLGKAPLSPAPLTPRERQVLQLVAEGNTTKEIAGILGVSVKTADAHRTRLMEKLDIHEVAGLVRYAIRHGLVQP